MDEKLKGEQEVNKNTLLTISVAEEEELEEVQVEEVEECIGEEKMKEEHAEEEEEQGKIKDLESNLKEMLELFESTYLEQELRIRKLESLLKEKDELIQQLRIVGCGTGVETVKEQWEEVGQVNEEVGENERLLREAQSREQLMNILQICEHQWADYNERRRKELEEQLVEKKKPFSFFCR